MISKNQTFILTHKVNNEIVNKIDSTSLSEAVKMFAIIKQLRPDQLLEIYSVHEQSPNGK
tara:strand:+ start:391 stop:570 length:180 start_codon:yes stop_codon:yes gene_type:complete